MQIKNSDENFIMCSRAVEVQFLDAAVFSAYSVHNSLDLFKFQ